MVGKSTEIFLENFHRYGLTKTEIEIVQMLFEGMDKKAITDSLFISEETVKKHIYNIFRKAQVKNRQAFGTYFEYFGRLKKPINQLIYRLLMHFDNRLSGEGGIRTNYIISLIINILTNRKQSYYTNYTFDFLAVVNPLYKEKESSGKAQIINAYNIKLYLL